jgi:hypothetical protein
MNIMNTAASVLLLASAAYAQEPAAQAPQAVAQPAAQQPAPAVNPQPQKYSGEIRAAVKSLALLLERAAEVPPQKLDELAPELTRFTAKVNETLGQKIISDAAQKEDQARAARAKTALQEFRSALQVYYVQNGGKYPRNPADLAGVPELDLPGHAPTTAVTVVDSKKYDKDISGAVTDSGGWLYFGNPASANYGLLIIDCRHREPGGDEFFKY